MFEFNSNGTLMKKIVLSLLIFTCLIAYVKTATACDCNTNGGSEGFYAEFHTQSLPQNAKGVLFFVKTRGSNLPGIYNKIVPEHFSFQDQKDKREIPFKLKKLKMEKVRGDSPKYEIYRVEPIDGFKAGHEYTIKLKEDPAWDPSLYRHILNVKIDSTIISRSDLLKTVLSPIDESKIESIYVEGGRGIGSCAFETKAKVQNVRFELSPRLEPYRDSLRYFVYYQSGMNKQPWIYKKNSCITANFGRSAFEIGTDVIFVPSEHWGTPLVRNKKYQISGSWVFPEVDATVFDSPAFEFSYPR